MRRRKLSVSAFALSVVVALLATRGTLYGQGATSTLSGVVIDKSSSVIPGATVDARNVDTGARFGTLTDYEGVFSLPAMPPGTYEVTTSLTGFKKNVIPDVRLNVATVATLRVTLEIGGVQEVITVTGGAEIVQTQSSTVSTTIDTTQISNLPLVSRDAINALTMLPGVDTASTNRNSTVSGLPRSAINITIDGVNTQDNNNKTTEGLFSLISPRLDAIEEVTVSTATAGADASGQGAVQIKFITRSGTNNYVGSAYYYLRDPRWNSNYWFNSRDLPSDPVTGKAPVDQVKLSQPGIRMGGPIVRDQVFFFVNFEAFNQPNEVTRNRTILTPLAAQGVYSYAVAGATRQVNLLQLAAANGQVATLDPTVDRVMSDIFASTLKEGGLQQLTDPNEQRYTFTNASANTRYFPTGRLDYNIAKNHRASFSYTRQNYHAKPDTLNNTDASFPGFPVVGSQNSIRTTWASSVRSTLTPNLVNEVHGGYTNSLVTFNPEVSLDLYKNASLANTGAYNLNFAGGSGNLGTALSNPYPTRNSQGRENPTISIEDTMNWLHGGHSVSMGGAFTHIGLHSFNQNVVPQVNFGLPTGDPALAMFSAANFQGASTANINAARDLYAMLTGHITSIASQAILNENTNKYEYLGNLVQRGQMHEMGFFVQDSWRVGQSVTLNFGVRYELQFPFVARNASYSQATLADLYGVSGAGNLFKPGTLTGQKPVFTAYAPNVYAFNLDKNNYAPNVGFTWRPSASGGLLQALLGGDDNTVIRAAYGMAFNRQGIADYSGVYSANSGATLTTTRSTANGNLGPVPLLFRDQSSLGAPAFASAPVYPLSPALTDSINIFDPNIETPFTHSFTIGFQRELSKNMAFEVRYVGNRNRKGWVTNNFNETNITENGFKQEFRNAQANLQANIAAGRGSSFAYFGPGTGTTPLPVYLAYFSGVPTGQAADASKYTSANWTSTNFTNPLAIFNPQPLTPAGTNATTGLGGDPTRIANAIAAGLPANFFRANADITGAANMTQSTAFGKYDSVQIEVRRRLSAGLQISGNYVMANAYNSTFYSLRVPRELTLATGVTGGIHQAVKFNWVYELPFGEGKRFANGSGFFNQFLGGWGFDGNARIQTGQILSFGNVRLVGMTDADLRNAFTIRIDDTNRIVYSLPQDIIDNTIKAFSTSATSPTGYGSLGAPTGRYFAPANGPDCIQQTAGDCAPRDHNVTGPMFMRVDLSASKRIGMARGLNFEFRADFLNAFNNVNFLATVPANNNAAFASAQLGQVTTAYQDVNNTQDPGGRLVQLGFRVNW